MLNILFKIVSVIESCAWLLWRTSFRGRYCLRFFGCRIFDLFLQLLIIQVLINRNINPVVCPRRQEHRIGQFNQKRNHLCPVFSDFESSCLPVRLRWKCPIFVSGLFSHLLCFSFSQFTYIVYQPVYTAASDPIAWANVPYCVT